MNPSPATKHFIRHYVEMVVAMFLGMALLGLPTEWALGAFGSSWSDLHHNAPALMLLVMAVIMTVPMVGWMAYRGHGRRPNAEMAASMFLPTFGVMDRAHGAPGQRGGAEDDRQQCGEAGELGGGVHDATAGSTRALWQ
ncbi:MAG TPA: hypothetical protein VE650_03505 [Acetobacteraceae bacterium]|nr:hypothetical protein [Acetobacteraceae bacterium]